MRRLCKNNGASLFIMADIQSNLLKTLSKVIDSTKPGYAPTGLGAQVSSAKNENTLTLTVVAVRNNAITVQTAGSADRFSLEKSDLQGLGSRSLVPGDKLVLISNNNPQAISFNVRSEQQNPSITLQTNILQTLKQQWPDLTASILKQAQSNVLNEKQYPSYTQNAKVIISTVIDIALQNKAPQNLAIQASAIGKIVRISPLSISLKLNTTNTNKNDFFIQLPVPAELSKTLKQGQNIQLSINTKNSTQNNNKGPIESLALVKTGINIENETSLPTSKIEALTNRQVAAINQLLGAKPKQVEQLISPILLSQSNKSSGNANTALTTQNLANGMILNANSDLLNALPSALKQSLLQAVSSQQLQSAQVQISQNTQNQLVVRLLEKPVIINIERSSAPALDQLIGKQVALPNAQSLASVSSSFINNSSIGTEKQALEQTLKITENSLKTKLIQVINQTINSANSTNTALNNNASNPSSSVLSEEALAKVNVQLNEIKHFIGKQQNFSLAKGEAFNNLLGSVLGKLNTLESQAEPELKSLLKQVISNISATKPNDLQSTFKQSLISGSSDIQASLSTPSLAQNEQGLNQTHPNNSLANNPLTNNTLLNSTLFNTGGKGLVSGLVTMFQASLQAKLISQQPQLLSQLTQFLPSLQAKKPTNTRNVNIKAVQDLQRLDPKHSLIDDLSKLLNQHNLMKLSSFESSLQGQDSFYYTLPNLFSSSHQDFEILIKKKQYEQSKEDEKQIQQHWQLSMKLDIGKLGKVLAKINLVQDNVDLHMYASSSALKDKIEDFLPILNKRLQDLGLKVKQQCYLGKIPDTLYKTEYQVVHAYV